jgi:hypothetical protein
VTRSGLRAAWPQPAGPGRSSAKSRPIAGTRRGRRAHLARLGFCQCAARAGPAGTPSWQCWRTGRRRPGGLQERPAACSLVGQFMIVAAAPGSAGPRRHGHAGRVDRPCRIGGACQLRAWGKRQAAWTARAVRSAEARSLAGRVSLLVSAKVRTQSMRSARSGRSLLTGLTVRLPQLVQGPPTRGHATVHTVTETKSEPL